MLRVLSIESEVLLMRFDRSNLRSRCLGPCFVCVRQCVPSSCLYQRLHLNYPFYLVQLNIRYREFKSASASVPGLLQSVYIVVIFYDQKSSRL